MAALLNHNYFFLPKELHFEVFKRLSDFELHAISQVSKSFHDVSLDYRLETNEEFNAALSLINCSETGLSLYPETKSITHIFHAALSFKKKLKLSNDLKTEELIFLSDFRKEIPSFKKATLKEFLKRERNQKKKIYYSWLIGDTLLKNKKLKKGECFLNNAFQLLKKLPLINYKEKYLYLVAKSFTKLNHKKAYKVITYLSDTNPNKVAALIKLNRSVTTTKHVFYYLSQMLKLLIGIHYVKHAHLEPKVIQLFGVLPDDKKINGIRNAYLTRFFFIKDAYNKIPAMCKVYEFHKVMGIQVESWGLLKKIVDLYHYYIKGPHDDKTACQYALEIGGLLREFDLTSARKFFVNAYLHALQLTEIKIKFECFSKINRCWASIAKQYPESLLEANNIYGEMRKLIKETTNERDKIEMLSIAFKENTFFQNI